MGSGELGLPEGISLWGVVAVLLPIALVTIGLRQAPFSARRWLRDNRFFAQLSVTMPIGVMVILVGYTFFGHREHWVPWLLAAGLTFGLHAWRRNSGLSILAGTVCYMVLLNTVVA